MSDIQKGYALIGGSLCASAIFNILADYIFRTHPDVGADELLFWSLGGAVLLSAPYFLGLRQNRRVIQDILTNHKVFLYKIILASFAGALLYSFALKLSSSGITNLLGKSGLIFTVLLGVILLKEKLSTREIIVIFFLVVGLATISGIDGEVSLLATSIILLSAFCYALFSFFLRQQKAPIDIPALTYIRASAVFILTGVMLLISGKLRIVPLDVLVLGAISEVFGIILWALLYIQAHRYLPISKLNIVSSMDMVVVPLAAFFVFGDTLSAQKILGAIIILTSVLYFLRLQRVKGFRDTIDWYDKHADMYASKAKKTNPEERIRTFLNYLPEHPYVLEAGCAGGHESHYFIKAGAKTVGVDISKSLLKIARRENPASTYVHANFLSLPFADDLFDGVWAHASLVHLETISDVAQALSEFSRVVKPGGHVLIYVKKQMGPEKTEVIADSLTNHDRFFRYFTVDEIKKLTENAGLSIIASSEDADEHGRPDVCWVSIIAKK